MLFRSEGEGDALSSGGESPRVVLAAGHSRKRREEAERRVAHSAGKQENREEQPSKKARTEEHRKPAGRLTNILHSLPIIGRFVSKEEDEGSYESDSDHYEDAQSDQK